MVSIFPPLKQLGLNSNRNFCITPELYKKIVCTDQYSKFLFAVFINTVTTLNIIKKIATVLHVGSLLPKAGSILGVTLKEWILTSVQFRSSVVSDSLRPHEPQHARPPYQPPTPGVYSNSCPSSW